MKFNVVLGDIMKVRCDAIANADPYTGIGLA